MTKFLLLPLLCLLLSHAASLHNKAAILNQSLRLQVNPQVQTLEILNGGPSEGVKGELHELQQWLSRATPQPPAVASLAAASYPPAPTNNANDEMIEWMAEDGVTVLCPVPRKLAIGLTLRHRGIGVLLLTVDGRVLVHKRSATKRIFPSMCDMYIGGVCGIGEPSLDTMRREVEEEAGIRLETGRDDDQIAHLGQTMVQTSMNYCQVECYAVVLSAAQVGSLQFRDGEIVSGEFTPWAALVAALTSGAYRSTFVPDGMQVWDWMVREKRFPSFLGNEA